MVRVDENHWIPYNEPAFERGTYRLKVDASDATMLFYHINGRIPLSGDSLVAADVNEDDSVNLHDAERLFYFVSGVIAEL